jgi:hypothetical protein
MTTDGKYLVFEAETVHGRLRASTYRGALRLAQAFFPEVPDVRVLPWGEAADQARHAAKIAGQWLTYEQAIKLGLIERPVEEWAGRLQQKFMRAGGR